MGYHHFTTEERCCLRENYKKRLSYRKIAELSGRNVSSVSRELRRINRAVSAGFSAIKNHFLLRFLFIIQRARSNTERF